MLTETAARALLADFALAEGYLLFEEGIPTLGESLVREAYAIATHDVPGHPVGQGHPVAQNSSAQNSFATNSFVQKGHGEPVTASPVAFSAQHAPTAPSAASVAAATSEAPPRRSLRELQLSTPPERVESETALRRCLGTGDLESFNSRLRELPLFHHEGRPLVILHGNGPHRPRLLVVGGRPSADDLVVHLPFSGNVGEILGKMLHYVGTHRNLCYQTTLLKASLGQKRLLPSELQMVRQLFAHELSLVQPQAVLVLGQPALTVLLGADATLAGNPTPRWSFNGIPCFGSRHPLEIAARTDLAPAEAEQHALVRMEASAQLGCLSAWMKTEAPQ